MAFPKVTDAQIENALMKNFGNVTMAALELGVHPSTIRIRVDGTDRAKYAAVRYETAEQIKDLAEMGAYQHVLDKDPSMIRFVLARKGKDRGWGSSVELGGTLHLAPASPVPADSLEDDDRDQLRDELAARRAMIGSGE